MSKSKAQKAREKCIREGRRNPSLDRGSWHGVNPVEKKTPTMIEMKQKLISKHKKRYQSRAMDDTFSFYSFLHRIRVSDPESDELLFFGGTFKRCGGAGSAGDYL